MVSRKKKGGKTHIHTNSNNTCICKRNANSSTSCFSGIDYSHHTRPSFICWCSAKLPEPAGKERKKNKTVFKTCSYKVRCSITKERLSEPMVGATTWLSRSLPLAGEVPSQEKMRRRLSLSQLCDTHGSLRPSQQAGFHLERKAKKRK